MPRRHGQDRVRQLPIDQVEIGPADPARLHGDQDLVWSRLRHRTLNEPKSLAWMLQHHGVHQRIHGGDLRGGHALSAAFSTLCPREPRRRRPEGTRAVRP